MVLTTTPVAVFFTSIEALPTTAPLGSTTVPVMVPSAPCPNSAHADTMSNSASETIFMVWFPPTKSVPKVNREKRLGVLYVREKWKTTGRGPACRQIPVKFLETVLLAPVSIGWLNVFTVQCRFTLVGAASRRRQPLSPATDIR